jgi:hypothetical protein
MVVMVNVLFAMSVSRTDPPMPTMSAICAGLVVLMNRVSVAVHVAASVSGPGPVESLLQPAAAAATAPANTACLMSFIDPPGRVSQRSYPPAREDSLNEA